MNRPDYDSVVSFPLGLTDLLGYSLRTAILRRIAEYEAANPDTRVVAWGTWNDDGQQNLRLYLRARKAEAAAVENGGKRAETKWEEGLC